MSETYLQGSVSVGRWLYLFNPKSRVEGRRTRGVREVRKTASSKYMFFAVVVVVVPSRALAACSEVKAKRRASCTPNSALSSRKLDKLELFALVQYIVMRLFCMRFSI